MTQYETVMQTDLSVCLSCGERAEGPPHHIIHGTKHNKRFSEKNGLMAYLCYDCHYDCHHGTGKTDIKLKKAAQREFLKTHTLQEWMAFVGKNYLWEEDDE